MDLPENCIACILSRTAPVDTCRLSLVSHAFCSAAQSDDVWDRFLPSDINSIIDRSDPNSKSSLLASPSKKALYLTLSDHPILIDDASKSFQLDKRTGKKCYMFPARDLRITWGDDPRYWKWIALPESRFPLVAQLRVVWWFDIKTTISTHELSPHTQYAVFLVFKMMTSYGFHHCPVELTVGIVGGRSNTKHVCLDPNLEEGHLEGLERPKVRSDGWLEIEMGDFFNSGLGPDEVEMIVMETKSGVGKSGFFLEGIEVRPKM